MSYLKKIIFAASLAVASLGFSVSSNAALITHDIIVDAGGPIVIGEITVHLFENGATGLQDIEEFVSWTMLGAPVTTVFDFIAIIDRDNVFAGIEFLAFDVDDADFYAYLGIYDAFALDPGLDNFIDIFDDFGDFFFTGELSLGEARVVSEPSVLALFALALVGFGMRRRAQ